MDGSYYDLILNPLRIGLDLSVDLMLTVAKKRWPEL
jgi:hypothetical protein